MNLDCIKFDAQGLVPAIAQDINTGAVVMLAYMNKESLEQTLQTGQATYYSRSRKELWIKGATSGNTQEIISISYDCDGDALLLKIKQKGAACHTGEYSCFHNKLQGEGSLTGAASITEDYNIIIDRIKNPKEGSYTNYLFEKGMDKMCKKVGEEATEVVIAAKNGSCEELKYEVCDLIYHTLVVMANAGVTPEEIYAELEARRG